MWVHRNSILHDPDHFWQKQKRDIWDQEIKQIFTTFDEDTYSVRDLRYFKQGAKIVLNYPDELKTQWLAAVQSAKIRKLRKEQNIRKSSDVMARWMGTGHQEEGDH